MYTVIVGCGRVGARLAQLLSSEGQDVVIIDHRDEAFGRLGEAFNGITIKGNATSTKVLQDAGIERAGIFCALTNTDNINIMAAQVAKKIFKVPRVIARVYDPRKAEIYGNMGMDVLSGTALFAAMIRDKIVDRRFSGHLIETGEVGMLEVEVPAKFAGKRVDELNIPEEFLITAVQQPGQPLVIPRLQMEVQSKDHLFAVVKMKSLAKIKSNFDMED